MSGFGRGTNPLLPWEIQCTGDEATLGNCSTTAYDPNQCQQVAGVICEGNCMTAGVIITGVASLISLSVKLQLPAYPTM